MQCANENCVKIAGFIEERGWQGTQIQFTGSPGIYQYHNENIFGDRNEVDMFPNPRFRQKQSKLTESQ